MAEFKAFAVCFLIPLGFWLFWRLQNEPINYHPVAISTVLLLGLFGVFWRRILKSKALLLHLFVLYVNVIGIYYVFYPYGFYWSFDSQAREIISFAILKSLFVLDLSYLSAALAPSAVYKPALKALVWLGFWNGIWIFFERWIGVPRDSTFGMFWNRGMDSLFFTMTAPMLLTKNALKDSLTWMVIAFCLVGLIAMDMTTALGGGVIALSVCLAFTYKDRVPKRALIPLGAGLACVLAGLGIYGRTVFGEHFLGLSQRDTVWKWFLDYYPKHYSVWFGSGLGTFQKLGPHAQIVEQFRPGNYWFSLHNDYLQMFFETGVVGSILLFGGLGLAVIKARKHPRHLAALVAFGLAMATWMPAQLTLVMVSVMLIVRDLFEQDALFSDELR